MHLKNLSIINFKNYREATIEFHEGVNCFSGANGSGKTNLLDAIHYLCLCKSYFNPSDSQQIFHNEPFFVVQGDFVKDGDTEAVYCGFKRNHKKQFKRKGKEYQRLADHIGVYPLVMISPYDSNLVSEGSEERRKFLDNAISQTDHFYLDDLIQYNKVVANRNALLKRFSESGNIDTDLISIFNEQMITLAEKIYARRRQFLELFIPIFNEIYQGLSSGAEPVSVNYESQLHEQTLADLLAANLKKDVYSERSNYGVHKDDLVFMIGDYPLKKFGSQGQQKSYLIALKLAHYTYLHQQTGHKPLILLDDIFDKLDETRIRNLLQMVSDERFGQLFITDTEKSRLSRIFEEIRVPCKIIEVNRGSILESVSV